MSIITLKKIVFCYILTCLISYCAIAQIDTSAINIKIAEGEKQIALNADSSIMLFKQANTDARRINYLSGFFLSGFRLSNVYKDKGMFYDAIKTVNYLLAYARKIKNKSYEADCLFALGEIQRAAYNPAKAMSTLQEALQIYNHQKNIGGISKCYNRIAAVYFEIKNDSLCLIFADSSNIIAIKNKDIQLIANNEELMAAAYRSMRNFQLAILHLEKALQLSVEYGDSTHIPNILNNFGYTYIMMKDFPKAIKYALESYHLSINKNILIYKINSAQILSNSYMALHDIYSSYYYSHISDSILFSSHAQDKMKTMMDITEKYEADKKENQRHILENELQIYEATLRQRNIAILSFVIILTLISITILIILRNRKKIISINNMLSDQKEELLVKNSELQNTFDRLKTLEEFKESMTGMIVHDLLNPLGIIISPPESHTPQEQIEMMKQSGKYMTTLVSNLLDIQKFESHQMKIDFSDLRLTNNINEAFCHVFSLQRQKHISLFNLVSQDIFVKGDKEILIRTMINLLANAIKFSDEGMSIKVSAIEKGPLIEISVTDNGTGIPADKIDHIFEKFIQLESKYSGPTKSTGLGLTFCKMAVEAHGGTIYVESNPKIETTFYFTLPKGKMTIEPIKELEIETVISINKEIIEKLQPLINELRQISIYKITEINKIISNISETSNPIIIKWISELKNAVYSGNEKMYKKLLEDKEYFL